MWNDTGAKMHDIASNVIIAEKLQWEEFRNELDRVIAPWWAVERGTDCSHLPFSKIEETTSTSFLCKAYPS